MRTVSPGWFSRVSMAFGLVALVCLVLPSQASPVAAQDKAPIRIGAIYPLSVGGPPAVQEYDGVRTAFHLVNQMGGIRGRNVRLVTRNVTGNSGAAAVLDLKRRHVSAIIGSESSLVGIPVSKAAESAGMMYLEAGAVATMLTERGQPDVFRTVVTGQTLGRSAAGFAAHVVAPRVHIPVHKLRVAVAYINDVYGSSVGKAQIAETHRLGMDLVGVFAYQTPGVNMARLVSRLKRTHPDVVLVAAYLQDGKQFRRETIRQHLRVDAMIGTSSSFCMPAFGKALGWRAVGLFAADKPDTGVNPAALDPAARQLRNTAKTLYHHLYGGAMTGPSVAGFVAGWVLLHDVLPHAASLNTGAIRNAFLAVNLPMGSEINGAGVYFARPNMEDGGQNLRATSVTWQWQHPGDASIVYPPGFATTSARYIPLPAHP